MSFFFFLKKRRRKKIDSENYCFFNLKSFTLSLCLSIVMSVLTGTSLGCIGQERRVLLPPSFSPVKSASLSSSSRLLSKGGRNKLRDCTFLAVELTVIDPVWIGWNRDGTPLHIPYALPLPPLVPTPRNPAPTPLVGDFPVVDATVLNSSLAAAPQFEAGGSAKKEGKRKKS